MLKEPDLARYSTPRTHRTYTRQFKAELVAACQQPGASIAAIALQHGMNANVLHRWLKEHERDGRHRPIGPAPMGVAVVTSPRPAFIPLKLPTGGMLEPTACDIKIELRKGAVSMILTWPISAAGDLAQWTRAILK
ncbi:transposase [Rhodoferax sp.]|uniref:transposase n=1 Tax=Rhodoferax sp. TaxID=50421 RepID=UPI0026138DD8|nr:transposase [Rhodoferax sp.]MDD3937566.1 transposase [Rhodoferax sp.]